MKRFFLFILAIVPLSLLAAGDVPAAAAEAVDAENNAIAEIANQFGVSWPTLTAQIINFCLVALVLYHFAVKPVTKALDERQKKIADGLQYAEEMKVQLVEAERERAAKIKEAAEEAQKILSEAREQSKEMIEKKTQEAAAQAEAMIRKASEATELERQKILSDVRKEVARLVVNTTSKVLSRDLTDQEKETFSESATEELAGANS